LPKALARAWPYEGIHIVLFCDRIQKQHRPEQFSTALGHVMAHEIAHILEGVSRHSESGIMKANWTTDDYSAMASHPLAFADEDVVMIHKGMEARESRLSALR